MRALSLLASGLIIIALFVSGCTTTPSPAEVTPTPVQTVPPGSPIVGSWVLESMVSAGTPVTMVQGTTITATFGPTGTFSGRDGCNSQSGSYMVTGSQIQVGPNLVSTMMACPTPVMDQASTYTRILVSPNTWQVSGDRLTLQDSRSNILVYVKQVPTVPTTAAPVTTAPAVVSPVGSWDLTSMTYVSGGSSVVKTPDSKIYAIFGTDGTIQGSGGCNVYNAGYTTNGSAMTVSDIIKTLLSCGNVYDTQERTYLAILGAAAHYENTGTQLTIYDAATPGSKLVYKPGTEKPVPVPTAIVGSWTLTSMTKNGAALTVSSGVTTTATFKSDGTLSGNGGCNQYSGTYVVTGSSAIAVSPLATTRMACPEPAMSQETTYLGILQDAAKWGYSSASGKLTLTDKDSNTLVYARAA